jgi:hypothetical protein
LVGPVKTVSLGEKEWEAVLSYQVLLEEYSVVSNYNSLRRNERRGQSAKETQKGAPGSREMILDSRIGARLEAPLHVVS